MVETGLMAQIKQMSYEPARAVPRLVEVISFDDLRAQNDRSSQRAEFNVLAFVDAGDGLIVTDFTERRITRGSVVWIAPGVVHRWRDVESVEGLLFLFLPTAPLTDATRDAATDLGARAPWQIPAEDKRFVDAAREHCVLECTTEDHVVSGEMAQLTLSALLARLAPPTLPSGTSHPLFRAFRQLVEREFRRHHDAAYYSTKLGFASRTLTRAVKEAVGVTPKAYIADRLILEAKRLLAHDGLSAAVCAKSLGFSDASNFAAMFRGRTGDTPGRWQARNHPGV